MTQDIEVKLSHLNEAREELKLAQAQVKALEKDILRTIMESGEERNEIPFDYAGRCYNATIRVDESRNLAPTKELTIEGIRQLLPEGEQTTVKAEAYYNSLYSERPVSDKVTIKVAKPKGEESAS